LILGSSLKKITACFVTAVLIAAALPAPETHAAVEPVITAKAAMVYCENTGETVYAKNETERLAPYSITKVMTALVTVMKTPLDTEVKVSEEAAGQPGSEIGLEAGETVTVEELLYGALLESGNDAAYALAEGVWGSAEKFVKRMNRTAKNIGCENTHFANPTGLDDNDNYTTCEDLVQISRVALDNETIKEIMGTRSHMMKPTDKSGPRQFRSSVFDLLLDDVIAGGKNGAGGTGVTSLINYEKNGLRLYLVLLGESEDARPTDLESLVKYAEEIIEGVPVVKAGEKVADVRIKRGAKTKLPVYTETEGYAYIPKEGSKSLISTKVEVADDVEAPVRKGAVVGKCIILVGGEKVNEIPLIIKEDVAVGWVTSNLGIPNSAALILGAVLGVFLLLVLIVLALRLHYRRKRKKARKQRAMEIAEQELREEQEREKRGWDM